MPFLVEGVQPLQGEPGLIGIAFGLVTWLFAYATVILVSAVVGGTWDQRRQKAKGGAGT
ncbi:MAG TPA: hypothetical protein VII53_00795 [Solirubrobacteraceae bacterium]